jgi:hypothetical protein
MKMGIGIGWPNATSGSGGPPGWFLIVSACGVGIADPSYTDPLYNTIYQPGDYVFSPDTGTRVLLGAFTEVEPIGEPIYRVEGPAYNGCT